MTDVAVVQTQSAYGSGSGTVFTITPAAPIAAGNGVVICIGYEDTDGDIVSVTGGGTFVPITGKQTYISENRAVDSFACVSCPGATAFTITMDISVSRFTVSLLECSSHDIAAMIEGAFSFVTRAGIGGTTDALLSDAVTTVTPGALVIGWAYQALNGGTSSLNPGTGMLGAPAMPDYAGRGRMVYLTKAIPGSQVMAWTPVDSASSSFIVIAFIIKPADEVDSSGTPVDSSGTPIDSVGPTQPPTIDDRESIPLAPYGAVGIYGNGDHLFILGGYVAP